ncbi:MAG: valine--tRNA ligase [Endomicrobiia bacterium]|nr:valine--tRNA ligase [Endomicrobiia bacterium]
MSVESEIPRRFAKTRRAKVKDAPRPKIFRRQADFADVSVFDRITRIMELPKAYESSGVEESIYAFWLAKDLFSSRPDTTKKPFTIVIPPPNVTGSLHMGHALNNTLQDALIRYKRLAGFNVCWVPGADHGGIATQNVVEKLLLAEGKNKNDLGREKFLERMWKWREATGDTILEQLKKLGCALDFSRTRFTLDEVCSRAVREAFARLFEKGLIYRGKRLVNWCPRCMTALSDIEVEHEEEIGKLWHIKYPIVKVERQKGRKLERENDFVVVATTRPETMLGDTAVAVNPSDERYKKLVGRTITLPLVGREIKIIADEAVDSAFGTGAVKVTPAHDPTDFDIGARHNLEKVVVIGFDGKMTPSAGKYAGLDRYHARKEILNDLEDAGLLLETVEHPHAVGVCYRCSTTVEPLISEQWFLKVGEMSRRAVEASRAGKIKFYPASWEKPYIAWLENLRDWCISRQIWWGHRIPVYYCKNVPATVAPQKSSDGKSACPPFASVETPVKCPHCGGSKIEQETDVLDTWFSSALWPFSVFGWATDTKDVGVKNDLEYYYPTSVLVTGHEILYLWVARMVQFGLEFMCERPFSDVYIHGIVRDKHGKKMSKSLGNVIDPLDIIKKYGADALRFAMISSATAGRDIQLSDDSFVGARNFANKLYNASRYILMNLEKYPLDDISLDGESLEETDKWILSECAAVSRIVRGHYESYELDKTARAVYDFTWNKFCDWYIEFTKERLYGIDAAARRTALKVLVNILADILKIIHPIMPFVTESLWRALRERLPALKGEFPESIMETAYPSLPASSEEYLKSAADVSFIVEVVTVVRQLREEMKIPAAQKITLQIRAEEKTAARFAERSVYITKLARADKIESNLSLEPRACACVVVKDAEIFIPLEGIIDIAKENSRLASELSKFEGFSRSLSAKLSNEKFLAKAPASEVENTRAKLAEATTKIEKLKSNIKYLG